VHPVEKRSSSSLELCLVRQRIVFIYEGLTKDAELLGFLYLLVCNGQELPLVKKKIEHTKKVLRD